MYLAFFVFLVAKVLFYSHITKCDKLGFSDIVFTIISQGNIRHEQRALKLKNEIEKETNFSSVVYLTHQDYKHVGDWTILPILPMLWKKHSQNLTWIFFCTDDTKINLIKLKEGLENLGSNDVFVGRGLIDDEPTIIHHFKSISGFKYPLFSSGFAIHFSLFKKLVDILNHNNSHLKTDFSIDASHELALFIKKNVNGIRLTSLPTFCVDNKTFCATHVRNNYVCDKKPVNIKNIFFAVKTCSKFYEDRVPVVKKTWGQWTYTLKFFSDTYEKNIPTVQLEIPNTNHGHCGKTQAIINEISKEMKKNRNLKWAVISDDDTIFSTYRLQELLGCYNHSHAIAIGERYGYNVVSQYGYNYITGGGGIILSRPAIKKFSEGYCKCPSNSTPDDMFLLGVCLHQLNISLVHNPLFHQARPNDYSKDYLMVGPPVSFHKHWMIDPIQVYKEWFELSDLLLKKNNNHIEL